MELRQGNACTARLGEELSHQGNRLLRALPGSTAWRELTHKRPRTVPDLHEPLLLEVAIGLRHSCGIHSQFGGQLSNGWKWRGTAQRAGRNRQSHALGDLHIERNGTAGVNIVKHDAARVAVYRYSITVREHSQGRERPQQI